MLLPGAALAEEAADMFDCTACHPMKVRDFKSRRGNPIVSLQEFPDEPTGKQDIASTSGMCFSCHDGFVEDSREVWKNGYQGHRVGMPSSHAAEELPVNKAGNVYCGTCHSAHLSDSADASAKTKPFMRAGNSNGDLCQGCHVDQLIIVGTAHDKGSRRASDFEHRGTCGTCHAAHASGLPLMWARSRGDGNHVVNTMCQSCHKGDPQPAEHPASVIAWSQDVRQAVRSNAAAEMPVYDAHGLGARVGSLTCATCHDVHRERAVGRDNALPGQYLRLPEVIEPLCADCHGPESMFLYKFFHSPASR
jgi:nitrate/TMAO reductase-like tetraheme cytochrome c subunit